MSGAEELPARIATPKFTSRRTSGARAALTSVGWLTSQTQLGATGPAPNVVPSTRGQHVAGIACVLSVPLTALCFAKRSMASQEPLSHTQQ